ncbi:MAG: ketoacyl-ACP synthase III [Kineothrix sp.]|nr:ketoacyl-ACP synthase III [Kineothrix sp.]
MVLTKIEEVKISAMAAAVSTTWTALTDMETQEGPEVIAKFSKKTGVKGRYDANLNQTTADFCFAAAKAILKEKKISPDEIGILVFVTQSADYSIPATACILQERLGIPKDCIAFDVNLGCSGFSYGLNIAASMLKTSNADKALLLCGDTSAKEKNWKKKVKTSHSASMLFGDSGTATLLAKEKGAPLMHMISKTDGAGFRAIIAPYGHWRNPEPPVGESIGSRMDDIAVFNFATSEVPELVKKQMEAANTTVDNYDCLVLHQANLFILKQIAKRTGFSMDKTLVSIDEFGNTSSASIPISLVKEYGDVNENKDIRALMCGFGVGLSWSTVDAYMNVNDILPLVHTDESFDDGYDFD